MNRKTKALTALVTAAAVGGTSLAGAGYAGHRGGGMGFPGTAQFEMTGMEIFNTFDADGDGEVTQDEIGTLLNERRAAHDGNGDGNLDLEEFARLWSETMRPYTVRAFQTLDTDGNGIVTRAEYDLQLAGIIERLDRSGDGRHSKRERRHDDDDDGFFRWWDDD